MTYAIVSLLSTLLLIGAAAFVAVTAHAYRGAIGRALRAEIGAPRFSERQWKAVPRRLAAPPVSSRPEWLPLRLAA